MRSFIAIVLELDTDTAPRVLQRPVERDAKWKFYSAARKVRRALSPAAVPGFYLSMRAEEALYKVYRDTKTRRVNLWRLG